MLRLSAPFVYVVSNVFGGGGAGRVGIFKTKDEQKYKMIRRMNIQVTSILTEVKNTFSYLVNTNIKN